MNRFEALHALGLEENATETDIRLSYYGLEKAVGAFDFSDIERLATQVEGMVAHAKESRTFLLSSRNQSVARKVRSYAAKNRGKLTVTPVEEKTARLHGCEQLRDLVLGFLYNERSKCRTSILVLVLCIVISFIILRYLRGMPRIVCFAVLGAVAIAGSTILTTAILQARKARAHVVELDDAIAQLRRDLGLDPVEEEGAEGSAGDAPGASDASDADPVYELPDADDLDGTDSDFDDLDDPDDPGVDADGDPDDPDDPDDAASPDFSTPTTRKQA